MAVLLKNTAVLPQKMPEDTDFRFRSLLYFLEIVNSGSQSEAADNLEISQPALSQTIDSLEQSWGIQLFEKKGRARVLTEAGKALVKFGTDINSRTKELQARLELISEGGGGTLNVGMIDSVNLYILPQTLQLFADKYPQVNLHLLIDSSRPLWKKLLDFELDLAFVVYSPSLETDFDIAEIAAQNLFLYAPKKLDPKTGAWALYPPGSQTRQIIDLGLYEQGIIPDVLLESANPQILAQMVNLGFCSSILPETEADSAISQFKCHKVSERRLVALTRKSSPADERIQALVDMARSISVG